MEDLPPRDLKAVNAIQNRLIEEATEGLEYRGAVLMEAPTGAGKTRMSSITLENFAQTFEHSHGRKPYALVLAHRDHLASQFKDAYKDWNPDTKLSTSYSAHGKVDETGNINFGVINTVAERMKDLKTPDIIVIDEAHHASESDGAQYNKLLSYMQQKNPNLAVLACTGTPSRPDDKHLHPILRDAITTTAGYGELERAGQIIMPQTIVANVDMRDTYNNNSSVGLRTEIAAFTTKGGKPENLGKHIRDNRAETYRDDVLRTWDLNFQHKFSKENPDARLPGTLVFCEDHNEAKKFLDAALEYQGIRVALVDSTTAADNAKTLTDYADGKIDMIVSVKMLDEGIDIPRTRAIIIDRPSTSETEYHQMCGRAMRKGDDPILANFRPVVIDAGGSTAVHGRLTDRARVTDYIQDVLKEKAGFAFGFKNDKKAETEADTKAHSNWHPVNEKPETFAITDGKVAYYLRETKDGLYDLAIVQPGKNSKTRDDKIPEAMPNITAEQVREVERKLYKDGGRNAVLALEATLKGDKVRAHIVTEDRKNWGAALTIFMEKMKGVDR